MSKKFILFFITLLILVTNVSLARSAAAVGGLTLNTPFTGNCCTPGETI